VRAGAGDVAAGRGEEGTGRGEDVAGPGQDERARGDTGDRHAGDRRAGAGGGALADDHDEPVEGDAVDDLVQAQRGALFGEGGLGAQAGQAEAAAGGEGMLRGEERDRSLGGDVQGLQPGQVFCVAGQGEIGLAGPRGGGRVAGEHHLDGRGIPGSAVRGDQRP
jgi:hypothetical protein